MTVTAETVKLIGPRILVEGHNTEQIQAGDFASPFSIERHDAKIVTAAMTTKARRRVLQVGSKCRHNVEGWIALVNLDQQPESTLADGTEIWHEGHIHAYLNPVIIAQG